VKDILQLHGLECSKCTRPAVSHNFRTGQTIHVSPYASHCQVHRPRSTPTPAGGE
jgi:hypothetical protein